MTQNEISHYESLKKQDTANRKLIKKLQLDKQALKEQLILSGVSQQRELLIDFCTKLELKAKQYSYLIPDEDFIDEYLKDN